MKIMYKKFQEVHSKDEISEVLAGSTVIIFGLDQDCILSQAGIVTQDYWVRQQSVPRK